jgi:hypothetical protein
MDSVREAVPAVNSFHDPRAAEHHNNSECVLGASIHVADRVNGDGGKPLCWVCSALNDSERRFANRYSNPS